MNIGETIKKLRKQKDMTQEQLAEYLNISPQAISRWEINSTLPDITLIPMLANIFDVTTDMLLGVDIEAKEKRIDEIIKEAYDYTWIKQYDEAEKLLRDALKEYPNSYKLMDCLAFVLFINVGYCDSKWNEEEKKIYNEKKRPIQEEIITLGEKILDECADDNLRHTSIQRMCNTYARMGENEKAKSFAKKMPHKYLAREYLMTEALKGTEKYNYMKEQIAKSGFFDTVNSIGLLINSSYVTLDDGTETYSPDERIMLNHKIIDIINILIEKGSFGDYNLHLINAHRCLSSLYAQKGDASSALNHFRLAAEHAVLFDSMPPVNASKEEYTCLLLRGIKFPFNMAHCQSTMAENLLEKSSEFDSVLPASELEAIRNELRKHTKTK